MQHADYDFANRIGAGVTNHDNFQCHTTRKILHFAGQNSGQSMCKLNTTSGFLLPHYLQVGEVVQKSNSTGA
mgnify:FL=1